MESNQFDQHHRHALTQILLAHGRDDVAVENGVDVLDLVHD
jgi:hypothetical protein